MAVIRTVEDLTTDERFIGYYDYEEAKEQEMEEIKTQREEIKNQREEIRKEGIQQANIKMVKNMIKEGLDVSIITKCTDLPLEQIENLKKHI